MEDHGLVERVTADEAIDRAVKVRAQTTRARLRGEFVHRAKERGRRSAVDWVHLKLDDQAQRTAPSSARTPSAPTTNASNA